MAAMVWSWDVSNTIATLVYAGLISAASAITVIYLHIKDPIFHQVAYAVLTALVLTRSIYLMYSRIDNREAKKDMLWTIVIGVSTFFAGFILWIIDNEFCDSLRSIRRIVGVPWAFFFGNPLRFNK
jgi:dihydroceramidase